jgi:hypothetical protein
VLVHAELRGRHAGPQDTVRRDGVAVERQAAERTPQFVERQAGVDQRPEHHVAGNAGKTIEVQHPRH